MSAENPTSADGDARAECVLVLGILTIASSFRHDIEEPASSVFDTIQWWVGPDRTRRIRTFALDHEMHVHEIELGRDFALVTARSSIRASYGSVLRSLHEFDVTDVCDAINTLQSFGLCGSVVAFPDGLRLWTPDGDPYQRVES